MNRLLLLLLTLTPTYTCTMESKKAPEQENKAPEQENYEKIKAIVPTENTQENTQDLDCYLGPDLDPEMVLRIKLYVENAKPDLDFHMQLHHGLLAPFIPIYLHRR